MAADDLFDATPIPPLAPDAMGVPPMGPPPPVPVAPPKGDSTTSSIFKLLAGALAAGMGPGGGTGLLHGMSQGQQRADHERQIQQQQAQTQYNQTRTDWEQQQKLNQQELDKRSQTFQTNVQSLRKTTAGLKTKEQYDSYITAYANGLQGMGYKVDANYLRQAAPYVAQSATKQAQDVLTKWMGNDLNKKLLTEDPQRAMTSIVPFDRDGDGVPEKVTIGDLGLLAGMFSADPKSGAPMFAPAGTVATQRANADGILQSLIKQDEAEGKVMSPARMIELQEKAIRLAGEAKPKPAGAGSGVTADDIKPGDRRYKVAEDLAFGRLTFPQFRTLYAYSRDKDEKTSIYEKASTINPNFNPASFELGYKFAANPKVEQQVASINNVLSGVPDLLKFSDAAKRAGATSLNGFIQRGGIAMGGKRYTDFRAAQIGFADELSGALGYGSATDMSREMGFNMVDPNLSPDNFRSAVENVVVPFVQRKKATLVGPMGIYGTADNNPGAQTPTVAGPTSEQWVRDPKTGKLVKP